MLRHFCVQCPRDARAYAIFFLNDTATTEIYTRSLGRQRQMCIRDRFTLDGDKLHGSWVLVRMRHDRNGGKRTNWLLIKLSLIHISEPTRPY